MATVTGLTAERMLEIEAESIIDGDVVGNNLILRRHDGTTIDAGPVKGPKGDTGPAGVSAAMASAPILDVGMAGQLRAGRALTVADFTNMGLSSPIALFNLTDLSNLGSGGALSNKGAVPFGVGINGLAATAAVFAGATTQGLYISDVGAGDPYRIKVGSWGCWFKSAKRTFAQMMLSKDSQIGTNRGWYIYITPTNQLEAGVPNDGGTGVGVATSITDPIDDRWHFGVATYDGTAIRLYLDGVLEATTPWTSSMFGSTSPLNVGGRAADAVTANGSPFYGRIDEAFVTADVLSEDQVRQLYCAKIPHGYSGTPKSVLLNIHRRRKGVPLVASDFPSQPLRLYNLVDSGDLGSNNVALTPGAGPTQAAGPDGAKDSGRYYSGSFSGDAATDAGLPSGVAVMTFGAWFKTIMSGTGMIISYGSANAERSIYHDSTSGLVSYTDGPGAINSVPWVRDGQWHQVVVVCDNTAGDGLKVKMYLDGRLVATTTTLNGVTLAGASRFRIGARFDGSSPFSGHIARAFVHGAALTSEQVRALFLKSGQDMGASPKNPGDHVEGFDATNIYATFDTIESQNLVDLAVMA